MTPLALRERLAHDYVRGALADPDVPMEDDAGRARGIAWAYALADAFLAAREPSPRCIWSTRDGEPCALPSGHEDCCQPSPAAEPVAWRLTEDDVVWVVNDNAELGVKIGEQFFFLYKGRSLVYETATHDDDTPMYWRTVGKREFGECCHPLNLEDPKKIGTVSLSDSDRWQRMPPQTLYAAAPAAREAGAPRRSCRALCVCNAASEPHPWSTAACTDPDPRCAAPREAEAAEAVWTLTTEMTKQGYPVIVTADEQAMAFNPQSGVGSDLLSLLAGRDRATLHVRVVKEEE